MTQENNKFSIAQLGFIFGIGMKPRQRRKTLNVVQQGLLNRKCEKCGHKNKKCTC